MTHPFLSAHKGSQKHPEHWGRYLASEQGVGKTWLVFTKQEGKHHVAGLRRLNSRNGAFRRNSRRPHLDLLGNVHSSLFLSYFNRVFDQSEFQGFGDSSNFKQSKKKTELVEC